MLLLLQVYLAPDLVAANERIINCFGATYQGGEGELEENVVCANFAHTTPHGAVKGKTQIVVTKCYNLDVIISVDYCIKSIATVRKFRQVRFTANNGNVI